MCFTTRYRPRSSFGFIVDVRPPPSFGRCSRPRPPRSARPTASCGGSHCAASLLPRSSFPNCAFRSTTASPQSTLRSRRLSPRLSLSLCSAARPCSALRR
eukprot:Amastigsp_a3574_31.p5 type:complete len:100 gc:universal Amastigsp_a3574_31:322-621(+)